MLAASACGGGSDSTAGPAVTRGDGGESAGKVGVILPDATTSPRWEANDRPSLQAAFDAAGVESDIQNAGGDKAKFGTICDSMINAGVQVLMIVNLDSDSGGACLRKAAAAGIQSIDYDRLTLGGGASYYVSFDNVVVGELMGQGLQTCLDDMGKTKANIVYINGDPTDNNAALFKQGYEQALQPKIDSGDYTLVGDQTGLLGRDEGRYGLRADLHAEQRQGRRRRLRQRHHGRRHRRPSAGQRPRRQGPGDRSGRQRRGPAAGARRHAVHDRLQGHQPRGEGRLGPGDRADPGRQGRRRRDGHRLGRRHRDRRGGRPVGAGHARRRSSRTA